MEVWKNIKEYEDNYQISNYGRVKSLQRTLKTKRHEYTIQEKILSIKINPLGYCRVGLYKDSSRKWFSIHRLVALHFLDNPENLPEVNHIDNNKQNNIYTNLEWCTRSENVIHQWSFRSRQSKSVAV